MILKTLIPPKSTPRHMIQTRRKFLPFYSDLYGWRQILPISSEHNLDALLKRHRNILYTIEIEFCIKKLSVFRN